MRILIGIFAVVVSAMSAPQVARQEFGSDPVAYIGHGAFFDRTGREINVTPQFIDAAQRYYLNALYSRARPEVRAKIDAQRAAIQRSDVASGQNALIADSLLIDALIAAGADPRGELAGKQRLLRRLLRQRLSPLNQPVNLRTSERFTPSAPLVGVLRQQGLDVDPPTGRTDSTAYIQQCSAAGVPIPPDWGDPAWVSKGVLANEFISDSLEAEVFAYSSTSPPGTCIALPRSAGDRIELLGIICAGSDSSNVCFWDNQKDDEQYPIQKGTVVSITEFAGGPDLMGGSGGICTGCHTGENPFIIHPKTSLGLPNLAGFNLQTKAWYKPMVDPGWPQNDGPLNELPVDPTLGSCYECHTQRRAGRLPAVAVDLGYCSTVLRLAMERTMPPFGPGDPSYAAHAKALMAACGST